MNRIDSIKAKVLAIAAIAIGVGLSAGPINAAEDYPTKPVSWVIPFGAGGGTDRLSRILAAEANKYFGVPLKVENRSGAGGVAGWEYVLGQPADGYNIFMASPTPIITLVSEEQPPISPDNIAILAYLATYASLIVVNGDEFPDWDSFVSAVAERPVTIAGTNSTLLGAANVLDQAGVEPVYVSYESTGEAVTDFLGGHVDAVTVTESTGLTLVPEKGSVLMNTSSLPLAEDVDEALGGDVLMPRDLGYTGLAFPRWVGVHPDTPEPIKARIAELLEQVAMDEKVQKGFADAGSAISFLGRKEAAADYAEVVKTMRKAVRLLQ